jgi:hypothetical protein
MHSRECSQAARADEHVIPGESGLRLAANALPERTV